MVQAVLFDLDGTLLDRDKSVELFIRAQYERLHQSLSHIEKETYISRFIELDNHGYVWKDKVYQQLVDEFAITSLHWQELLDDYLKEFPHHCVGFPHVIEMLEQLKMDDMAMGMITNGFGQFQMDNLRALSIENYFDVILVSEWEGIKKPNPLIFIKALQELNVEACESIFIGDHPENDIRAAQNVGMKAIWKRNNAWDNVNADAIIEDYSELSLLIKTKFITKE